MTGALRFGSCVVQRVHGLVVERGSWGRSGPYLLARLEDDGGTARGRSSSRVTRCLVHIRTPAASSWPSCRWENCGGCACGRCLTLPVPIGEERPPWPLGSSRGRAAPVGRRHRGARACSREVRLVHGVRPVSPRRACCQRCGATPVLSPSWSAARRGDGAEVIALSDYFLADCHTSPHRRVRSRRAVQRWQASS